MKTQYINVSEFYKLISLTPGGRISTNSLDEWLRLKTNQKFTVVEIAFLREIIQNLEIAQNNYKHFKQKWNYHLSEL